MDSQLTQVCCPEYPSTEIATLVEDLRRDVAALRARVHHLERENLEFRQQAGYWKSRHRDAVQRIGELEQQVEQLQGEKRQVQADLFGRRSETRPLNDRSNHLDDPQDDTRGPKRKRGQQPGNSGPKRRDYSSLVRKGKRDITELRPARTQSRRGRRDIGREPRRSGVFPGQQRSVPISSAASISASTATSLCATSPFWPRSGRFE